MQPTNHYMLTWHYKLLSCFFFNNNCNLNMLIWFAAHTKFAILYAGYDMRGRHLRPSLRSHITPGAWTADKCAGTQGTREHACIPKGVHTHAHTHTCMHTHTHMHAQTCTHTQTHAQTCTHTQTHAHTHTCMHKRAHTHKRMHTHTHTHAHMTQCCI